MKTSDLRREMIKSVHYFAENYVTCIGDMMAWLDEQGIGYSHCILGEDDAEDNERIALLFSERAIVILIDPVLNAVRREALRALQSY